MQQEVSPPLWQRQGHHHEHPEIENQIEIESDKDMQQKVSPLLWQREGHHHEHPEIEKKIFLAAKLPKINGMMIGHLSKVMKSAM